MPVRRSAGGRNIGALPPLFGRDREVAAISTFVESLHAGRGGVIVVDGEAGLGKSSLLDALAARAAGAGIRLARGQSAELDQSRPFGALIGALDLRPTSLDPDAAEIGRVLGRSPAAGPSPSIGSWQVADAILDHVEQLASRGPLLVVIDDVQWADVSTLRILSAIVDQSADVPLGLAVACRPAPHSTDLDRLLDASERRVDTTSVHLTALEHSDVANLLANLAGAPPGPRLSRLAEGAGGNPLFVGQLVASLQARSQLEVGTLAEATSDDVPVDLRVAIERRVRALAPPTRQLLRLASVLGTSFSLEQLAAVSGEDVLVVADQLRPAFDDGLLGDDGIAGVAFRHDLVREAVSASLPAAERTELHHQIGRRLAATDTPPAHVAEHLAVGAVRGDVDAVKWLRKAGLAAAAHDAAAAVGYLERAVALSLPSDPRRHGLVAALVNQLVLVGRYADAERHSRASVAETHDPVVEALLRLAVGSVLFGSQRLDEARREFLLAAEVAPDVPIRLSARACAGFAAVCAGDVASATPELTDVLATAEQHRIGFVQAVASATLASALAMVGDLDAALGLGGRGVLLTGEAEYFWGGFMYPHLYMAPALLAADRIGEARAGLRSGRTSALQRNLRIAVPAYDGLLALCDFLEGGWDDAAVAGLEAGRARAEVGSGHPRAPGASVARLVAAARGERSVDDTGRPIEVGAETDGIALLCIEYAHLAKAANAPSAYDATALLSAAWEARRPFHLPGFGAAVGPALVNASLASGDRETAREVAEHLRVLAGRAPTIRPLVAAAHRAEGLIDASPEPLLAAVELMEDSPRVYERAVLFEDAGVAVASRDADRARKLLGAAFDTYDRLDARRDSSRLVDRMRDVGLQPRRSRPIRPRFGWDALTPTELRVVDEVARGHTNGEVAAAMFVSRHTVESHLKHIFAKLGVRSRAEVAAQGALHRS